jgi:hypothetical protein
MTEDGAAKAPANKASRRATEAALSRSGGAEPMRASDHIDDDREDERDHVAGDDREMSDDEFLHMIRDTINQSVLPDLPKIPGYHTFWATTTNSRDTIPNRLRMGYQYIRVDELPGWEGGSLKTGEYAGCVAINEMVAMKIPERRYQMMMAEFHHRMPLAEEEKIKAMVQNAGENALRDKGRIVDEDGFVDNIVQKAPVPHFA